MSVPAVGVALKWVDLRPTVDPLTGAVTTDPRTSGPSPADQAALEWALRLGERSRADVVAVTVGPEPCGAVLDLALTAGAARAVRVDAPGDTPSPLVAAGLATVLTGCRWVLCGDWSLDRGSGSVPAYLAAELGVAQALGLVSLAPGGPAELEAERRLDGGRRERLRVRAPAVLSVEATTARLRRAPLPSLLRGARPRVEVAYPRVPMEAGPPPTRVGPLRPRPRALAGPEPGLPARERIALLAGCGPGQRPGSGELLVASPGDGARRLVDALRRWGYLEDR